MNSTSASKKILLATILTSSLSLAISQASFAAKPQGPGQENGGRGSCMMQTMNPVIQKAQEKFMKETVEVRKQQAEKRAAMRAIMMADSPDPDKAAQIAGELFDLQEQLRVKAEEYGLPPMGPGFGQGPCMGMKSGMGHGPKMGRGMKRDGFGPGNGKNMPTNNAPEAQN